MLEKLVENWLDSASERSYQAPFCQMLAAQGHTVVHSTRHAPTEFGKDIITIDKEGKPWAFQLKGNPGGRLTKSQVADIAPQLDELVGYAITHPGVAAGVKHKCVLVTNGQMEEEASSAIDAINRSLQQRGHGKNRITVWTRGHLLKMATELGSSLWPSEVENLNVLLEVLVHRGDDQFPHAKLHQLLQPLLLLSESAPGTVSKADLTRRITSAAVLVGVVLRSFAAKNNHYAILSAWMMFYSYAIATVAKHGFKLNQGAKRAVDLAKDTIYDALARLCDDLIANPLMAPSVGSTFDQIHAAVGTLMYGLMSLYWLWSEKRGWGVAAHRTFLEDWLPRDFNRSHIWGEACLPQILAHHWFIASLDATQTSEAVFAQLTGIVIAMASREGGDGLPSPYYDFEQVQRHRMKAFLPSARDALEHESNKRKSFFAEGMLHMLVRTNRKQDCQAIFPNFTRVIQHRFTPEFPWAFGLAHCERGDESSVVPTLNRRWSELAEEARDCSVPFAAPEFLEDEFLLALFVLIFPFRASAPVLRYLDQKLGSVWMIEPPLGLAP